MNIYVGNLLRTLSETELKEVFQVYGTVQTASIIKDKMTGDSRGFGFVEMPNRDEAMKAIASLNGKDLKGRNMTVNEAKPRTDGPRSGGFGGGGGGRRY
ncbi:MAG: RNA-binding protein [Candidatus Aminicenantes bacterium]|jgi:RNA recognition motif-containing protein|nr:RNA-binding protein [Candidatus Aminicenantes bacterium]